MVDEMDRRRFGMGFLGLAASTALPQAAEAQKTPTQYIESFLTPQELEEHKSRSAKKLRDSIPRGVESLKHLFSYGEHLEQESQMYLPDASERNNVISRSLDERGISQLELLVSNLAVGETGLYIFADVDEKGRNFQRLYVLRKEAAGVYFEKAYRVALAEEGFGNQEDSHKTPLGLWPIQSGEIGAYGEVVRAERHSQIPEKRKSAREVLDKYFNKIIHRETPRWFAKTFGEPASESPLQSRDKSEVVTARYTINEKRGIHIHGTNRSGKWHERLRQWMTLLGGRHRSTGCIRMSNTDVYDLGISGYAKLPSGKNSGTMVMIHATKEAKVGAPDKEYEHGSDVPRRRLLPGQPGYEEQLKREEQLRNQPR